MFCDSTRNMETLKLPFFLLRKNQQRTVKFHVLTYREPGITRNVTHLEKISAIYVSQGTAKETSQETFLFGRYKNMSFWHIMYIYIYIARNILVTSDSVNSVRLLGRYFFLCHSNLFQQLPQAVSFQCRQASSTAASSVDGLVSAVALL